MCSGYEELSRIMISMSSCAGACVGTVGVAGKKITGAVTSGVKAVGHLFNRPVESLEPIAKEKKNPVFDGFDLQPNQQHTEQEENSVRFLISSLESDLADARGQLKEMQSKADQTHYLIASKLSDFKLEKEALLTELEQTRSQAKKAPLLDSQVKTQADGVEILKTDLTDAEIRNFKKSTEEKPTVKPHPLSEMSSAQTRPDAELLKPVDEFVVGTDGAKIESSTENPVAFPPEKTNLKIQDQNTEARMLKSCAVTVEQVQMAVFDKVTDKVLLAKAVSDIASSEAVVRAEAVKTMAGIDHELSIKALIAQARSDTYAQVRQECIKSLTALNMPDGIPAIEKALTDDIASVR